MENNSQLGDGLDQSSQYLSKINLITVALGIIGFFVSLYSLAIHLQLGLKSGPQICDFNSTVNCSNVIGSSYGELAAIPLGAYGMTYFAIIVSAAFMPKLARINKKWLAFWELIIALVGFASVCTLIYISYFILHLVCPTCSVIQAVVTLYTILKIYQFIKTRKEKDLPKNDAFIKLMAVSLCLGIPPLAIGLIGPMFAPYFFSSKDKPTQAQTNPTPANQAVTKIPEKAATNDPDIKSPMMSFNKTNFVGNGEDYRRGDDSAKVIIQVFSDFGCPHCRVATDAILKAQDTVGLDKVLFVYRFFPLSNKCNPYVPGEGGYPYACSLAEAVRCSGQQGKFWEFKAWAFSGQSWDNSERAQKFSLDGMKTQATALGMNADAFAQCVQSDVELQKIKDDAAIANKMGIQGTPLIIINGEQYEGSPSPDAFSQAFYQALSKVN
jgi:protein-disulfide isomerase/uncharacterized membrane protein